ncbi:hypothetical protein COT40_01355 [Candidatus Peregrinibacteria bacterium CG08_land_8_20_14_0_20_41_10]|nr:MAG: hypothetical protein COT40_01355 [Candidatus Peregrinibacteria bacterium CG08_land_8_20_14_0_20_41_10]
MSLVVAGDCVPALVILSQIPATFGKAGKPGKPGTEGKPGRPGKVGTPATFGKAGKPGKIGKSCTGEVFSKLFALASVL